MKPGYEVTGLQDARTVTSNKTNLDICVSLKRFVSQTPYLIHHSSIAPHITGSRVLLEIESLCQHKDREKLVLLMFK